MNIKDSMNSYYDERAEEYDEIYTLGKGPASISDPNAYKEDVQNVHGVIQKVNPNGSIFDIPCGTGFWMPGYYKTVESIKILLCILRFFESNQVLPCSFIKKK